MKNACVALLLLLVIFAPVSAMADTWGDQINDPSRFVVLPGYNGTAVLDRETGLVWEQSPDTTLGRSWFAAQIHCNQRTVGNRKGWRLPTIQELASLIDATVPFPGPTLPAGHPFTIVRDDYWSATTTGSASQAWGVVFNFGEVFVDDKAGAERVVAVWCVRGGHGVDPQ